MEETDDLVERMRQIVGKTLNVEPTTLHLTDPVYGHEDSAPNDPYGGVLTGFYWVEVTTVVEEEFDLEIPDGDMGRLHTIADYANYVRRWQAGLPPFEERPAPAPTPTKKRADRKKSKAEPQEGSYSAWEFHHGHWERTEGTIQMGELETDQPTKHALKQCGYKPLPILCMGKREQGMHIEVYAKEHKEDNGIQNYYAQLWIGPEVESIYVSNLPSLLSLLHRLGPIIANSRGAE